MNDGRVLGALGIVGCVLALVFGLSVNAFAAATCGYPKCEEYRAANPDVAPYSTKCVAETTPEHIVYVYQYYNGVFSKRLVGYPWCDCTNSGHPIVTPSSGFKTDPAGSCDGGCKVKCSGWCYSMEVGNREWFFGAFGPDGSQCNAADGGPLNPSPQPPCDYSVGICYDTSGPKFCSTPSEGHPAVCVPSPRPNHGPDCGTNSHDAICAGTPNNPAAPPPPPPNPPIPPGPNGQPPPPDVTTNFNFNCQGGCNTFSSGPVTVTTNTDGGTGSGGGGSDPPGDDGGSGTGGADGQTCPDGSAPVAGRCPAGHDTCPDGSAPVNGRCRGAPGQCADGSQPVNGTCTGGGNCSNGAAPVGGVCPPTCPDGSTAQNGSCQAPWSNCPDGSAPVNGTCTPSACNPQTDPNHCESGGTASGGGSCSTAPSCNGDQIACATLFQSWSTRCAIEGHSQAPDDGSGSHTAGEVSSSETVTPEVLDGSGFLCGRSLAQLGRP